MRNYDLMRNILKVVNAEKKPLELDYFSRYGTFEQLEEELTRLKEEGLIETSMTWTDGSFDGGVVIAITDKGEEFLFNIENNEVWRLIYTTLSRAKLTLSYPLLKEVCEEVVRRYVMSKIPTEM